MGLLPRISMFCMLASSRVQQTGEFIFDCSCDRASRLMKKLQSIALFPAHNPLLVLRVGRANFPLILSDVSFSASLKISLFPSLILTLLGGSRVVFTSSIRILLPVRWPFSDKEWWWYQGQTPRRLRKDAEIEDGRKGTPTPLWNLDAIFNTIDPDRYPPSCSRSLSDCFCPFQVPSSQLGCLAFYWPAGSPCTNGVAGMTPMWLKLPAPARCEGSDWKRRDNHLILTLFQRAR